MDALRPSLLLGLLDTLRHNLSRNQHDVALFEVGRVFNLPDSGPGAPREERRAAVAITGQRSHLFWSGSERDAKFDLFDLKGIVEEFLDQFGLKGFVFQRVNAVPASSLFMEAADVQLGRVQLGQVGILLPSLGRKYDLRDPVLLAEFSLDQLLSRRNASKSFKPLAAFPSIRRDVAMLVPEGVTHDMVLGVVKQGKPANLETVDLFDVFRGKNVPEGQKSMAYAFTYRSSERTLVDSEVTAEHERLCRQFKEKLKASLRE
jgi:phenylalanyl-tRNA synthetase beta chain